MLCLLQLSTPGTWRCFTGLGRHDEAVVPATRLHPSNLLRTMQDALLQSSIGTEENLVSLTDDLRQVYVVFDTLDELALRTFFTDACM
jgi:hypothetical protein